MDKKINPFRIRSLLFLPAIKKEFINKVINLENKNKPDGIILDLEDSIKPEYKDKARQNLEQLFANPVLIDTLRYKYIICIRVNEYNSSWFKKDLDFINKVKPHFLMLPKIRSANELKNIRSQCLMRQFIVTIETLLGLKNLSKISTAMNFYDLLAIGYEDISSELLIERPNNLKEINPLTFVIMQILIEAREKNLIVLDAPSRKFIDQRTLKNLEEECVFNNNNGFNCKMAIHPNQIPIINHIFEKNPLINRTQNVCNILKHLSHGAAVTIDEKNEMIDTPSYKMYKRLLRYWDK